VQERGIPELVRAVESGEMAVSAAARVAGMEPQDQREQLSNPPPEPETGITRAASHRHRSWAAARFGDALARHGGTHTQPRTLSEPRSPSPLNAADNRRQTGIGHCQRTDDEVPFEFRWEHNGENNDSNQDPMG
jgi:hypothetical protein